MKEPRCSTIGAIRRPRVKCDVCAQTLRAGSDRCDACGSLRGWTARCVSCGAPVPKDAGTCQECGGYPRRDGETCPGCRSPMPAKARVCRACGRTRLFGMRLALGDAYLSLLVGLVSVITALVSILAGFPRSRTDFYFLGFPEFEESASIMQRRFQVAAYNSGNRPSAVPGATLVTPWAAGEVSVPLEFVAAETEPTGRADRVLAPGSLETFTLELAPWNVQALFGVAVSDEKTYRDLLGRNHRIELEVQEYGDVAERRTLRNLAGSSLRLFLCRATMTRKGARGQDPERIGDEAPALDCATLLRELDGQEGDPERERNGDVPR